VILRIVVAMLLALGAGSALAADPASIVAFTLFDMGASSTFALWVAGNLGTLATIGLVGFQMYGNAAAKRKAADAAASQAEANRIAYNAGLQDRTAMVLSSEAPFVTIYGEARVGGAVVAMFTSDKLDSGPSSIFRAGSADKTRDALRHLVIVVAAHEVTGIDEIYIDGDAFGPLDSNGYVTGGAFFAAEPVQRTASVAFDGSGHATLPESSIGLVSVQAIQSGEYGDYAATVPGATVSGTTVTVPLQYAGLTGTVVYNIQGGHPTVRVSKHLGTVGDTADAYLMSAVPDKWTSQHLLSGFAYVVITLDLNNQRFQSGLPKFSFQTRGKKVYDYRTSTTAYSTNPALCTADFLNSEMWSANTRVSVIAADAMSAASDADTHGYTCNGSFTSNDAPKAVLEALVQSMAGFAFVAGGWRILAGSWQTPVLALDGSNIEGLIEISQVGASRSDIFNGVRGTYLPYNTAVVTDFTPYRNATYSTADGGDLWSDMTFTWTNTNQGCQNLARVFTERMRNGLTVTVPAGMEAWGVQPGDRVWLTSAEFGWASKTFRVTDWSFGLNTPVMLTLQEDVAATYDAADAVVVDQSPNTDLVDPFEIAAPAFITATSGTADLKIGTDGSVQSRVKLVLPLSTNPYVTNGGTLEIDYRPDDGNPATPTQTLSLPGDTASTYLTDVVDGQQYLIRARYTHTLATGPWKIITHRVVGKTEAPPDVTYFVIDGDRLSWTGVAALDLAGYEIRFNYGSNTWWDGAAPLHTGVITDNPYTMTSRPVGPVTLLIKAVDTSGNYSAHAATILTDLGIPTVSNLYLSWPQATTFPGTIVNGAVSGGTLAADATDRFYGPDAEPFYGTDSTAVFYDASTYKDMSYTWGVTPTASGTLLLDYAVAASNYTIEYQRDSQAVFYGTGTDPFYGTSTDPFYGTPTDWTTWPGSLEIGRPEQISFRISTVGGTTRGVITTATTKLDVPDVTESLNDVVISAAGTRLPITKTYRAIENVKLTAQNDGNGGVAVRIEDKNAALGPLVKVFNAAGTAVNGLLDAEIQGY